MEGLTLALPGQASRTFYHRGTAADQGVIQQMFQSQDYALERLRRAEEIWGVYGALCAAGGKPLIIDAGANIGASAVYFCTTFPQAHVLALEPDPDNFELLARNTTGLDVDARRAGIAAHNGEGSLIDPGEGEWGYRTVPGGKDGKAVALLAASDLIAEKLNAGFEPFIAKIDIEGGETHLFSANTDWVDRFALVIIELHDWLLPRSANSRNFLKCMAQLDRDFVYLGENIFSIKNT